VTDVTGKLGHEANDISEEEFLRRYPKQDYPKPSVAVDLTVFTVSDTDLKVLLIRRKGHPHKGSWAFPGGFVDVGDGYDDQGESIEEAAYREMTEETSLAHGSVFLEQLYTFGTPNRDPRMRIISVAYYALVPGDRMALVKAGSDAEEARWFSVEHEVADLDLAFDHAESLRMAVERIQGKIDYAPLARELVPEVFTVAELRQVYEAVKGKTYNPASFRRRFQRMQTDGIIEQAPGKRQTSTKPAKVYRFTR